MANKEVLNTAIEELRRQYDEITVTHDQLRVKVLAFITVELALVAFLFATGINVPAVMYGLAFFATGVGCLVASFVLLVFSLRSMDWASPIDVEDLREDNYEQFAGPLEMLEYTKESYIRSIDSNLPKINSRSMTFDRALILLFIGVIILLVIKYGQGVIVWQNIVHL